MGAVAAGATTTGAAASAASYPTQHAHINCAYSSGFCTEVADSDNVWPDGNTRLHPTPFQFSTPMTGANYSVPYRQVGFETDLPAIESTCNTSTGVGCTLIPQTDQNQPASFYPYFTTTRTRNGCVWQFGSDIPGQISNFGQNAQYGTLLQQDYTVVGGGTQTLYNDFRNILRDPCLSGWPCWLEGRGAGEHRSAHRGDRLRAVPSPRPGFGERGMSVQGGRV
jgi:hypothetical protein